MAITTYRKGGLMLIGVLAFLGGVLTIFSPCVLPVIPFVFARADQPFRKSGLPMLVGMAVSFSLFAAAAAVGGNWVVHSNQYGRILAMAVLAVMGLALLFPTLAERLTRPLVHLGNRLQQRDSSQSTFFSSFILGISIGLLWAPLRRSDPWVGLSRRRAWWTFFENTFASVGIRRGSRDISCYCTTGRQSGLTEIKKRLRRRRVYTPNLGRGGHCRRCRDCLRMGYALSCHAFLRQHQWRGGKISR